LERKNKVILEINEKINDSVKEIENIVHAAPSGGSSIVPASKLKQIEPITVML
jgi:hypothetical protein